MTTDYNRIGVHRELFSVLSERFDIVDSVCTPDIDSDPANFYRFFHQYQDRVFAANERLVIFYCDFDYYPDQNTVPNTLYNIVKSIAYTDVSSDHVMIFTMSFDVEPLVKQLCLNFNISQIATTSTRLWHDFPSQIKSDIKIKHQKTSLFSAAIGVPRTHRRLFLASVFDKNLQSVGAINYRPHFVKSPTRQRRYIGNHSTPDDLILRTTVPFSRINEELSRTPAGIDLEIQHQKHLESEIVNIKEINKANEPRKGHTWCDQYLQNSLVHVINETVGQYPCVSFSEKTWRAIYSQTPFMTVGPQGSLKKLQSLGFRTFGDFWDESYDTLDTVYERVDCLTNSLAQLRNQDWSAVFKNTQPVLQHNFDVLSELKTKELKRIKDWLSNT